MTDELDEDLREIPRLATERALEDDPKSEFGLGTRIALVIGALIIILNTVVNFYNSLAVRKEVTCNHNLANALAQVGDQNRNITKNIIDKALSKEGTDPQARARLRKQYDRQFRINSQKRAAVLRVTCQDNVGQNTPTSIPSTP